MIVQVIFTAALMGVALVAFTQISRLPLVGGPVICIALFGAYLIWMPAEATVLAHSLGIGRGADLILYVWVLISFASLLVLYLNIKGQDQTITALARKIALLEADDATLQPANLNSRGGATRRPTTPAIRAEHAKKSE